ncbi:MAG TPA: hypothetical protein VLS96_09570, partial [Nodosilinea sp.]|nr:hypothetical protein [Nodosilinea sp.]
NLDASVQELIDLVSNRLQPGDPFISAFAALMRQLDRPYRSPMQLNMLRLRGLPSIEQEATLKQLFAGSNAATIESLLADIRDRTTVDNLYASGFSQQPISIPVELPPSLPAALQEVVDFPPPSETVLIWQGSVSAAERAAALALNGDEAFKTALEQLSRPRPAPADLPDAIRDQLQITGDDATGEQLTWVPIPGDGQTHSPTDEQIQLLQGIVADAGYEDSLRRLVTALLKNRQPPEPVSVPLAALPDRQQLSIPLPAAGSTRPTTDTLPDELQSKLLIGNAVIRYHGLMSETEGVALRRLYANPSDKAAIERLYQAAIGQGSQGRQVYLQARRGSAAPSRLIELNLPSLPED